ncbi:MAG: hypothetical protein PVF04_02575 [Anaerolineae bacterium]
MSRGTLRLVRVGRDATALGNEPAPVLTVPLHKTFCGHRGCLF